MNNQQKVQLIKRTLANKFYNGRCWICKTFDSPKGMLFHHVWYNPQDITRKQYPSSYSGSLDYHQELEKEIIKNPKRFRYLCNGCHQALERFIRFSDGKFTKLSRERSRTIKIRKGVLSWSVVAATVSVQENAILAFHGNMGIVPNVGLKNYYLSMMQNLRTLGWLQIPLMLTGIVPH